MSDTLTLLTPVDKDNYEDLVHLYYRGNSDTALCGADVTEEEEVEPVMSPRTCSMCVLVYKRHSDNT